MSNAPVEYIKHNKLGLMPVSTYGDGIKKVILLADRIAHAQNGVLLLDEIETAIHVRSYPDIFNFVVKACIEFNVQLFATTHSIEALDSILKTQYNEKTEEYDKAQKDSIRVITFRKEENEGKTLSRVLSGEKVFQNRENFGFEVRI
jgi:AAA15 family ATPase/GTPase